jgi:hypothetical protein
MKRAIWTTVGVIGLLLLLFLVANLIVGSGSTATIVEAARARCSKDGFPAQDMKVTEVYCDNGNFGFGGHATVEFTRVGLGPWKEGQPRILRVELHRRMNLLGWEAAGVWHEP